MNWSEEKRIRLVNMSHVIKMIGIISPNRFRNISSYINKVVIKHILAICSQHPHGQHHHELSSLQYFLPDDFLC